MSSRRSIRASIPSCYLTIPEVAGILRLDEQSVRRHISAGRLRAVRFVYGRDHPEPYEYGRGGGVVRVHKRGLNEFIWKVQDAMEVLGWIERSGSLGRPLSRALYVEMVGFLGEPARRKDA